MATIAQIKEELGMEVLNFNTPKDAVTKLPVIDAKTGKETLWMRHWDNERRIAVSIHKDTCAIIDAGGAGAMNLKLQDEEVLIAKDSQQQYIARRIVAYTPAEKSY